MPFGVWRLAFEVWRSPIHPPPDWRAEVGAENAKLQTLNAKRQTHSASPPAAAAKIASKNPPALPAPARTLLPFATVTRAIAKSLSQVWTPPPTGARARPPDPQPPIARAASRHSKTSMNPSDASATGTSSHWLDGAGNHGSEHVTPVAHGGCLWAKGAIHVRAGQVRGPTVRPKSAHGGCLWAEVPTHVREGQVRGPTVQPMSAHSGCLWAEGPTQASPGRVPVDV